MIAGSAERHAVDLRATPKVGGAHANKSMRRRYGGSGKYGKEKQKRLTGDEVVVMFVSHSRRLQNVARHLPSVLLIPFSPPCEVYPYNVEPRTL
jgi:hypothetical protein